MTIKRRRISAKQRQNRPPPSNGRPKGSPNKTTRILKDAALLAAEQIGEDGAGFDGLVGYLRQCARTERRTYLHLLSKLLPLQISLDLKSHTATLLDQLRDIEHGYRTSPSENAHERYWPDQYGGQGVH